MCTLLSDVASCFGWDALSTPGEACCSCIIGQCCCLCCLRCLSSQRRAANAIASRDPMLVVLSSSSRAAARVIGRSFAGTSSTDPEQTINWALGPQLKDLGDDITHRRRVDVATFWMSFATHMTGDQGVVIGAKHDTSPDGLGAVIVARRFGSLSEIENAGTSASTGAVICRYVCTGGMPEVYTSKDLESIKTPMDDRSQKVLTPMLKKAHVESGLGPHWCVEVMAVDPSAQGSKHCSRLMRAVTAQADAEGIPTFLEASGQRNKAIYEHFRFREVANYTCELEGDEAGSEPFKEAYAMVRPVGGGEGGGGSSSSSSSSSNAEAVAVEEMQRDNAV